MADVREVAKERSDGSDGVVSLALRDDECQSCLRENNQLLGFTGSQGVIQPAAGS